MKLIGKQGVLTWEKPWLRHPHHLVCHCNDITQELLDICEHYYLIAMENKSSLSMRWWNAAVSAHINNRPIPKLPYGGMLTLS